LNKRTTEILQYLHPGLAKLFIVGLIVLSAFLFLFLFRTLPVPPVSLQVEAEVKTIKWVDIGIPYKVLEKTM
jgi:hypothetical protein